MRNRKGQAAMEFLMTYGWAILIVVIAVAALAAFGVFSPQINELCDAQGNDFLCQGPPASVFSDGTLQVALSNGPLGRSNITDVTTAEGGDCTVDSWQVQDAAGDPIAEPLRAGQSFLLEVDCGAQQADTRFEDTLRIAYDLVDTGQARTGRVRLVSQVIED